MDLTRRSPRIILDQIMRESAPRLKKLEEPPIVEVVCGLILKPIDELDPVSLGEYWLSRRAQYPRREFKLPISASPNAIDFALGPDLGPIRTWLVSEDDQFIIQVQPERFYLNWRARGSDYPRFNDWEGGRGVLSRFLVESSAFLDFCARSLKSEPAIVGIELAKIDLLQRYRHWQTSRDLAELVPMLKETLEFSTDDEPLVSVRVSSRAEAGRLDLSIESSVRPGMPPASVMKIECRRTTEGELSPQSLGAAFRQANEELNHLFMRVVPESQHHRFNSGWKP